MILSLDLQEGQLIPQYCYVSNSQKHVSKKDEERMINGLTTVVFAGRR